MSKDIKASPHITPHNTMLYSNSYDLHVNGLRNARTVDRYQRWYEEYSVVFKALFSLGIIVPLLWVVGVYIYFKRKSFNKQMKGSKMQLNSVSSYVTLRTNLDKMKPFMKSVNKIHSLNVEDIPLMMRFPISQLKKMSKTLVKYNSWKESNLDKFNTPQFKDKESVFVLTTEKDLWENRNKAYSYWM